MSPITLAAAVAFIFACGPPEEPSGITSRPSRPPAQKNLDADWPMFRGNPRLTGVAPHRLPEKLAVRWRFTAPEAITSSAAIVHGVVYVGCEDGVLYALDLVTGGVRWRYAVRPRTASGPSDPIPIQSSPCVAHHTVFFGDDEGVFHAVDDRTSHARWTFETDDRIISSANYTAGRVLFGSYDSYLYCLSAADGRLIWKYETQGRVHGTPGITGDKVIVAGCDSDLHVVRLADGTAVATAAMDDVSGASAAVMGSRVYVGTFGNRVLGVDLRAGRIAWAYEHPDKQFPFYASAAVTPQYVLIGGRDKMLHALDPHTGAARWTFKARGRIDSSPVVAGDRVYFGSSDGNVYALDLATGRQTWRFETGAPISASPAVAHGCLVIGAEDGALYCFADK